MVPSAQALAPLVALRLAMRVARRHASRVRIVKAPSPLLGFNNNVRHKGRVFHIQTEDSGIRHPHIITHLFADGGRILKTIKTSYAEHVDQDRLAERVRAMMQEQHKAMFIALRDGQYDYFLKKGGAP